MTKIDYKTTKIETPESDVTTLYMKKDTKEQLKDAAAKCGFGPQETNKFLKKVLRFVDNAPYMFSKF